MTIKYRLRLAAPEGRSEWVTHAAEQVWLEIMSLTAQPDRHIAAREVRDLADELEHRYLPALREVAFKMHQRPGRNWQQVAGWFEGAMQTEPDPPPPPPPPELQVVEKPRRSTSVTRGKKRRG